MIEVEMTTKQIEELLQGKVRHDNIMAKVVNLSDRNLLKFKEVEYLDSRNRKQPCYLLDERSVNILMCSYSPEHAAKVVDEVYRLRKENQMWTDLIAKVFLDKAFHNQEFGAKGVGIEHPRKFVQYIKERPDVLEEFVSRGLFFERQVGKSKQDKCWAWTAKGIKHLLSRIDFYNTRTKELMKQEKNGEPQF